MTNLIAERMEILGAQSSTITDDVEIIVKETKLIVPTVWPKGNTGEKEAGETSVSDVKQSACLVWSDVFPFMAPFRASDVPGPTR